MPEGDNDLNLPFEELADGRFLLGSPEMVAEQIIDYNKRLGVNLSSFSAFNGWACRTNRCSILCDLFAARRSCPS